MQIIENFEIFSSWKLFFIIILTYIATHAPAQPFATKALYG